MCGKVRRSSPGIESGKCCQSSILKRQHRPSWQSAVPRQGTHGNQNAAESTQGWHGDSFGRPFAQYRLEPPAPHWSGSPKEASRTGAYPPLTLWQDDPTEHCASTAPAVSAPPPGSPHASPGSIPPKDKGGVAGARKPSPLRSPRQRSRQNFADSVLSCPLRPTRSPTK
jgi:hypothetical protein